MTANTNKVKHWRQDLLKNQSYNYPQNYAHIIYSALVEHGVVNSSDIVNTVELHTRKFLYHHITTPCC